MTKFNAVLAVAVVAVLSGASMVATTPPKRKPMSPQQFAANLQMQHGHGLGSATNGGDSESSTTTFYPTDFGGDPSGQRDSTNAVAAAIAAA